MRVAMVIIVVHPAPAAATAPASHGHAALFADLRVLCLHARGDFHPIRDEFGTQPHRVRRTSLLNIDRGRAGGALGAGLVKAAKKQRADRQCQPANEENGPHLFFPGVERRSRSGAKVAGEITAVDGLSGELWLPGRAFGRRFNGYARQNPGLGAGGFRQCPWRNARCRPR